jgi:hypothetical protein
MNVNQPALKLISYFRDLVAGERTMDPGGEEECSGQATFSTAVAQHESRTMRELQSLGQELARGWVTYWNEVGFLE